MSPISSRKSESQSNVRAVFNLVDQAEYGANDIYLPDFIEIAFRKYTLNPAKIRQLYLEEGLSASQIAEKLEVSKSVVIGWINRLRIHLRVE